MKTFKQYNENLRDKMVGQSHDDIIKKMEEIVNKREYNANGFNIYTVLEIITDLYGMGKYEYGKLLNILLENRVINPDLIMEHELEILQDQMDDEEEGINIIESLLNIIKKAPK